MMMMTGTGRGGRCAAARSATVTDTQRRVNGQRLHQLGTAVRRMPRRQRRRKSGSCARGSMARGSRLDDTAAPRWRGRRQRRSGLFQLKDLGAADDAAQRQNTLGDCRLDRLDETQSTYNAMSTRLSLHCRFRRHAHDALQTDIATVSLTDKHFFNFF